MGRFLTLCVVTWVWHSAIIVRYLGCCLMETPDTICGHPGLTFCLHCSIPGMLLDGDTLCGHLGLTICHH